MSDYLEFLKRLMDLGAVVWIADHGRNGQEFNRPAGWQNLTAADNDARLKAFQPGRHAVAVNTGLPITTVDADTRNGADIAKVQQLLADLKVVILAEVDTPGGGKHWHVPGHPDLPTTHFKSGDYRGVDIQSHGANVFLPGTLRPKYNGAGYTIVFDDLNKYDPADPAQAAGAQALTDWVAAQRTKTAKAKARKASGEWKLSPKWNGVPPDMRQKKYLESALNGEVAKVTRAKSHRNDALFEAALKLGSYVEGAGLPEQEVWTALEQAADAVGLVQWTGVQQVKATIASGLRSGRHNPRAVPRSFIDSKAGLLALDLANEVMASVTCGFGHPDRQFYVYDSGVWQPDEDCIRGEIARLLGNKHRPAHTKPVLDRIQYSSSTPILEDKPLSQYINCPNGMLDWKTGTLYKHSPDYLSTVQLPVEYNPAARCPDFEVFIAEVLPPDLFLPTPECPQGFIWELLGYLLYSGNPLQVAILLHGLGRNGKGVLIRVLKALLGEQNYSAVGLHELVENRFRAATLFRRLANLAGDLDAKWLESTATFKKITGNDVLQAEHKYGASFHFTPWCVPLYSINKPFGSADSSEGWVARWIIVPFPNSFVGREDRGLDAKLQTTAELQGIMRRGVEALPALMARGNGGRFADLKSLTDAKTAFVVASDAVRAWLDEYCDIEPGQNLFLPRRDMYQKYLLHADTSKPLSAREFYNRLSQIAGIRATKRQGIQGFAGIGFKSGSQRTWP